MYSLKSILIIFIYLTNQIISCPQEINQPKVFDKEIQFFAHRASRFEFDENTLDGFQKAYNAGARGFETDIQMSKDSTLIINHDESLKRTCGVDKQVPDLTDKELREIKTLQGHPLCFAQELVDFLADKPGMYVEFEIKTVEKLYTEEKLYVLCDKLYKMAMSNKPPTSEYLFTSFDTRALKIMKRLHPDAILMYLVNTYCTKENIQMVYDFGVQRIGCKMDGTTRQAVQFGHSLNMTVSLWPSSKIEDFVLGVALGSDALCCDVFFEVGNWARTNMPFAKLKGIVYPDGEKRVEKE